MSKKKLVVFIALFIAAYMVDGQQITVAGRVKEQSSKYVLLIPSIPDRDHPNAMILLYCDLNTKEIDRLDVIKGESTPRWMYVNSAAGWFAYGFITKSGAGSLNVVAVRDELRKWNSEYPKTWLLDGWGISDDMQLLLHTYLPESPEAGLHAMTVSAPEFEMLPVKHTRERSINQLMGTAIHVKGSGPYVFWSPDRPKKIEFKMGKEEVTFDISNSPPVELTQGRSTMWRVIGDIDGDCTFSELAYKSNQDNTRSLLYNSKTKSWTKYDVKGGAGIAYQVGSCFVLQAASQNPRNDPEKGLNFGSKASGATILIDPLRAWSINLELSGDSQVLDATAEGCLVRDQDRLVWIEIDDGEVTRTKTIMQRPAINFVRYAIPVLDRPEIAKDSNQ